MPVEEWDEYNTDLEDDPDAFQDFCDDPYHGE